MELGVPKGKLYMVEYDPAWAEEGRRVVELLRGVMTDAVDIIHGGSTSIPGMFSKPIIDIYIAVNELDDVLQYVDALEALGIHYAGEVVPEHRDFYMDDPVTGYRTHHIHALRYESPRWARYQRIFSYLRAEPRVRDAYTLLKRSFLLMYEDHPEKYGPAKRVFMDDVEEAAVEWAKQQG